MERLLGAYLELAAEGIGLGYLVRGGGAHTIMNLCWVELVPQRLPEVHVHKRLEVLAQLWNLVESLERLPGWWRRLFANALQGLRTLEDLESTVQRLGERARSGPEGPRWNAALSAQVHPWLWLGELDSNFLPGEVQFLTPTIACVHDRLRDGRDGRTAAAIAIWLDENPSILGPLTLPAPGASSRPFSVTRDPRFTEPFFVAQNDYRAVVSLNSSQFVLAVYPGGAS